MKKGFLATPIRPRTCTVLSSPKKYRKQSNKRFVRLLVSIRMKLHVMFILSKKGGTRNRLKNLRATSSISAFGIRKGIGIFYFLQYERSPFPKYHMLPTLVKEYCFLLILNNKC